MSLLVLKPGLLCSVQDSSGEGLADAVEVAQLVEARCSKLLD